MGMPVIPASAAVTQLRAPAMNATQMNTMLPSVGPPLPPKPAQKAAQPSHKATPARGEANIDQLSSLMFAVTHQLCTFLKWAQMYMSLCTGRFQNREAVGVSFLL